MVTDAAAPGATDPSAGPADPGASDPAAPGSSDPAAPTGQCADGATCPDATGSEGAADPPATSTECVDVATCPATPAGTQLDPAETTSLDASPSTDATVVAPASQVVYVVIDGATGVTFKGPTVIVGIDVPELQLPYRLREYRDDVGDALLAALESRFAGQGVTFTVTAPAVGPYSTVYLAADDAAFESAYGELWGISEGVDFGNVVPDDSAFVFTDGLPITALYPEGYGQDLAVYVGHEVGHLLGYQHVREVASDNQIANAAWKPYSHVAIAKDVLNDLMDDGQLTIAGNTYTVHSQIYEAVTQYPGYYFAGAVGPDGFPDLILGQSLIHPIDTGTWVGRLLDMAWAAMADPSFTHEEGLQTLAFSYGYATHVAGDDWVHTLANEVAGGTFPDFADLLVDDQDLANAIRHLMAEGYIGDATPGYDISTGRSLLPDGDISSSSTPGIVLAAPIRFIYEAFIKAYPGDPTAEANTGLQNIAVDPIARTFTLASGTMTFLDYGFRDFPLTVAQGCMTLADGSDCTAPQKFEAFGFGSADGKYTVADISSDGRVLTVVEAIDGSALQAGSGDEWMSTSVSRGKLLDTIWTLRDSLEALADSLDAAPDATPSPYTYDELESMVVAGLTDADPTTPAEDVLGWFERAYLRNWVQAIDEGVANWAVIGIASARALFDAEATRRVQNAVAAGSGADVDPARAAAEGIGLVDVLLAELNDPNGDGSTDDSFINNYLLPMFGVPKALLDVMEQLTSFSEIISDTVTGPLSMVLNPLGQTISEIMEIPKQIAIDLIEDRWGIPIDLLEQLMGLQNKMDLAYITVAGHDIQVFAPNDHERMDALMGIQGIGQSEEVVFETTPTIESVPGLPGMFYYSDAVAGLDENVEFDKNVFAAYYNSVVISKLLLLHEDPVGVSTTASTGMLSKFINDQLAYLKAQGLLPAGYVLPDGYVYDFSLLNVYGAHGGNIMTATLPMPGVTVGDVRGYADTKRAVTVLIDSLPWLGSIDADQGWRADSRTVTSTEFQVTEALPGPTEEDLGIPATPNTATATWEIHLAPGTYQLQATWLSNITQRFDNSGLPLEQFDIQPTTDALYQVYVVTGSGPVLLGWSHQNQWVKAKDAPESLEDGGLAFNILGSFTLAAGQYFRV
ncbi:MAG TPA: hypothetical protein VLS51_10250, partial [Propionibacteriaceae bacterium]|nr:hypothetical protein [Propionibacteriaceae bacterium]